VELADVFGLSASLSLRRFAALAKDFFAGNVLADSFHDDS
jgi:hypothetical protein